VLVIGKSGEGVVVSNLGSEAILALVPGDPQENCLNIRIIFYSVARKGIAFSTQYRYYLVNPLCCCGVAFEGSGKISIVDR
jgi:hypothetical protein